MSTGQFHKLLSPLSLGSGLTLKNRMIKAPQSSWFFEDDGSAGDRVIDFYEAIAAGGVGLVIVSAITWRSDHPAGAYGALHDDRFLPGMKRLVERCHAHGCPVFCQLHHSGASATNPGRFLGEKGFVSIKFRRISPEMDKEMSRKVLVNYKISVGDWLIKRGIYVTMKKHTRERGVGHER